jgi:putative DNA primase/helicase
LNGVTGSPVFAPDGTLQLLEGYNEQSKLYYNPTPGLVVPDVSQTPTEKEVEEARNLVMLDILGQFPFSGPKDGACERAHAAAMFLQPFVRPMIEGATPLYLIEKPTPGTGATLMVQALMYPFLGGIAPATTEGRSEEEWRKRITAKLQDAPALFFIDNLRNRLDSSALASVITSQMWEDRVLGVSEMTTIQALCLWIATGNNPSVSQELKRRCVRIRMDAAMPDPHLRSGFRHPRLLKWVEENRGKLIWGALTLVQNWIAKDRPKGKLVLGMFDDWAQMMGGILETSGIPGFLGNLDDFYQKADIASGSWKGFIAAWWQGRGIDEVKTVEVLEFAIEAAVDLGDGAGKVVSLGRKLTRARDRQFNIEVPGGKIRVCLVFAGTDQNAAVWRLEMREAYEGGAVLVERKSEAEAIADEIMGGEEW